MPVYEYRCSRYKNVFALHPKMDEDCKAVCPKWVAPAQNLISASHFVLKGWGFYVNDYPSRFRKDGKRKDGKRTEKERSDKTVPINAEGKGRLKDSSN